MIFYDFFFFKQFNTEKRVKNVKKNSQLFNDSKSMPLLWLFSSTAFSKQPGHLLFSHEAEGNNPLSPERERKREHTRQVFKSQSKLSKETDGVYAPKMACATSSSYYNSSMA